MREVRACESPVSFGALRRTINVHKMHCHVVRDPFSNLYLQCVYEFRISSASLPIESNLCFSRQLFVDSACLHSSTDNHGDSFRSVIILNRRTCLQLKHGVQVRVRVSSFFVVLPAFRFARIIMFIVDSKTRVKRETK